MKDKCRSLLKNKNNLLIVVLVGVLFLVITLPIEDSSTKSKQMDNLPDTISENPLSDSEDDLLEYCSYLEEKLEKSLAKLEGAGAVEVLVSLKSSKERIVEKDQTVIRSGTSEEDSQGGSRDISSFDSKESTIYTSEGSASEPYVVKVLQPEVEGVMVIAEGAGNGAVSKNISDALQALFGIEAHKIKVVKMETQ